jgi:cytochrome c peroxidase
VKKTTVLIFLLGYVVIVTSFKKEAPITKEKLGQILFFDPILSEDRSVSCASCHKPEFAFSDTIRFSKGVAGRVGKRNAPSVMNMGARESFFWDGRAASLEEQALVPIEDKNEMNLPVQTAVRRLNENSKYRRLFYEVFKEKPNAKNLGMALAAFERTLETSNTPNDHWMNDEPGGMNAQQVRGREVFREKGKCFDCHFTPDFTGDEFRSIGLFNGGRFNDSVEYQANLTILVNLRCRD